MPPGTLRCVLLDNVTLDAVDEPTAALRCPGSGGRLLYGITHPGAPSRHRPYPRDHPWPRTFVRLFATFTTQRQPFSFGSWADLSMSTLASEGPHVT